MAFLAGRVLLKYVLRPLRPYLSTPLEGSVLD